MSNRESKWVPVSPRRFRGLETEHHPDSKFRTHILNRALKRFCNVPELERNSLRATHATWVENVKNVKMSLLAFNGDARQFIFTEVAFEFESAGVISVTSRISMFRHWPYETPLDIFRLVLEILFSALILYQVFVEFREFVQAVRESDSFCQGVCAYWSDFSNITDWISVILTVTVIYTWITFFTRLSKFSPKSRYPVYIPTPTEFDCKSARHVFAKIIR